MSARADMAAKVAALKADGLNGIQIGKRLGISRAYAYELISDPEGLKVRARKASYRGKCKQCGAPTDGSNGPAGVPDYCNACAHDAHRTWTRDYVLDAIRTFNDRYGRTPSAIDWNPSHARTNGHGDIADRFYSDGCWPSLGTVQAIFGSWNAAIEAAGFVPPRPGQQVSYRGAWVDDVTRARIVARYIAGESSTALGVEYGIAHRTVCVWVRAAGGQVRIANGTRLPDEAVAA